MMTGDAECSDRAALLLARRTLFDQLDTDGSGGIDGDELAAGLAAKGYQVPARTPNFLKQGVLGIVTNAWAAKCTSQ